MTLVNNNLTIWLEDKYKGLEVLNKYGLYEQYLRAIYGVLEKATREHPRTTAIRFDLHLPGVMGWSDMPCEYGTEVITKFMESLKAQIKADLVRKKREGQRTHLCTVRYIWAKEISKANQPHYHVALLLNKDAYLGLGDYRSVRDNVAGMIYRAWASALKYGHNQVMGLIHFPYNPYYHLNSNGLAYKQQCNEVFKRLSYLAKRETKLYGARTKNFGCSRK
ncbi:TPA: inovirus Gp2 family protein [Vibrio parahaemolyticus]|uniref:inovirus Gp2 family protein n=1 Tax=Vibrio parahaemolyticus TaxID=670 RepID=UPI00215B89C4|nr:inovirus Gp2 family protein [Vibrio parahaemolyticus]MCR9955994.1 inovirus Gp2 family protein [Vibrio parahaemolyticus]HCH1623312.1 inovirus Gp2 family protein [Vibrio parahaemolyticus]